MMDWTDRHCRYLLRLLSPRARLYTEMVTAAAVEHGNLRRLLGFHPAEHPVALQLGGSDPTQMAAAARRGTEFGYDEININVGCPSDRVQSGRFGACLMATPGVVADCIRTMGDATGVPVTVKCRIGIDDEESYEFLQSFIAQTANAGCDTFVVHARKAMLKGLSPRQNRSVPALDYERVYRLKRDYPHLRIVLNGGIRTVEAALEHLRHVDGVMIGREAYHNPWFLVELERAVFGADPRLPESREQVVKEMLPYIDAALADGASLKHITRHMLGIFSGQPGAKAWRRYLSENAHRQDARAEIVTEALALQLAA